MNPNWDSLSFTLQEFPAPTIIINQDGIIVHLNDRALELFGDHPVETFLNQSILDFICKGSIEQASIDLMNVITSNIDVKREYQVHSPDGEPFWVEANGSRIEIASAIYDLVVFRSVNAQKKYQDKLIQSEKEFSKLYSMLRLMCDTVPEMIWAKDLHGKFLFTNQAFCDQFLFARDTNEPIGKDDMYFIQRERNAHPEDPNWHTFGEICNDSDLEVVKSGKANSFDENARIEGCEIALHVSKAPMFTADAKLIGTVGCGRNITERVQLKKELEAKEARSSALLNAIPDMMFGFTKDGIIVDYKAENIDDLYAPSELFIGKNVDDVLPSDIAQITHQMIERVFISKEAQKYQYALPIGGKVQLFESRMTMYGDDKYLAIVRNVTDQVQAQKELILAKNRAEESDKLKTAFLANLSHEIRTPMNGIMGFVEILKDELPEKERNSYIDIIGDCSKQLLSIISDIIEISILEAGQVRVKPTVLNLSKMMTDIYHCMQTKAAESPEVIFMKPEIPEISPITIVADEVKISQILTNLIVNAFKFTLKGSIHWGYRMLSSQEIEFFIQDTGIGIREEDINIIFDRFRQVESYLTRTKNGIGLGLSICKSYAELMGGKMRVESVVDEGSTFSFTLPINVSEIQPVVMRENINPVKNFADKVVLIAEDDGISFQYQKTVIEKTSAQVLHAWNGFEAVEMFEANPKIDLVLMDIKMPVMNGFDATYRIRAKNPSVPIITITAYALEHEKSLAITAGCNEYLTKPISINDLLSIIDKYL